MVSFRPKTVLGVVAVSQKILANIFVLIFIMDTEMLLGTIHAKSLQSSKPTT